MLPVHSMQVRVRGVVQGNGKSLRISIFFHNPPESLNLLPMHTDNISFGAPHVVSLNLGVIKA